MGEGGSDILDAEDVDQELREVIHRGGNIGHATDERRIARTLRDQVMLMAH